MTDHETSNTSLALLKFCRDLFDTNLTGTDFEDVSVLRVKRKFLQGPPAGQRDLHLHAVAREQWVDVLPAQWRQVGAAGCR